MAIRPLKIDEQIQALYIAYYGRAGEPDGVFYWRTQMEAGRTFAEVAAAFSTQTESRIQHQFLADPTSVTPASFIQSLYSQLLDRTPDTEGFAYWMNQLTQANGNPFVIGLLIAQFISGADIANGDAARIENKIAAAIYFAAEFWAVGVGGTLDGTKLNPAFEQIARDAVDNEITTNFSSAAENFREVDAFVRSNFPTDTPRSFNTSGFGNEDGGAIQITLAGLDGNEPISHFIIDYIAPNRFFGGIFSLTSESNPIPPGSLIPATSNYAQVYFKPFQDVHGDIPNARYYAVSESGQRELSPSQIFISIADVNDRPYALFYSEQFGSQDQPALIHFRGSDRDGVVVSYTIDSMPEHGTVSLDVAGTQTVSLHDVLLATNQNLALYFTPEAGFTGSAMFDFSVTDDRGATTSIPDYAEFIVI